METNFWLHLGNHLGIKVIAPFVFQSSGGPVSFIALLPEFGAPHGMVVEVDWDIIKRHASVLSNAGYGYSCCDGGQYDESDPPLDMLRDWGWSSSKPKPDWF